MNTAKHIDEATESIAESVAHSAGREIAIAKQPDRLARPAIDPMNALIEELRGEFRRGYILEDAQKEAARRKREAVLVVLFLLAGVLLTAALIIAAGHRPH